MAIINFFKKALPFLTTGLSLAGPAGMAASTILGKVLNVSSPTSSAIQDALGKLTLSPEIQAQLQEAENQYKAQMQSMGFQHEEELAALGEKDRDSARTMQMQTHSYTMPVLAYLAVIVLGFCVYMVGFRNLPAAGHDTLIFLLGIVASIIKDVYGYFFGSSAGSDEKTSLLAAQSSGKP